MISHLRNLLLRWYEFNWQRTTRRMWGQFNPWHQLK